MGFRENLKQELSYNGMLVKKLSDASGVHKRAIDTYLCANASMPPADAAVKIARALGVTVEYLVTGEEQLTPQRIREITRKLYKISQRDCKLIADLIDSMIEQKEKSELLL